MQRNRILVVLCLALAVVPACKKASESTAEKAAEREANVTVAGVTMSKIVGA